MARIERFEDVKAWQEARVLVKEIYVVTGAGEFARDFGLKDQLRRSAVSVLSTIAEGFERGSDREFVRFLYIAKGSCGEVRAQLYVAADVGYLPEPESQRLIAQCQRISRLISGLITYLQKPS